MSLKKEELYMSTKEGEPVTQGARIGKLETTVAKFTGMGVVLSALFSIFAVSICGIFFSTYVGSVSSKKDIEAINQYIKDTAIDHKSFQIQLVQIQKDLLELRARVEMHERIDDEKWKKEGSHGK